jgi:glycosyltransferase involved in cell wall biosynthesis
MGFDHVIYQSAFSKEQADRHLYYRGEAFSIIHNGVDIEFFKPQEGMGSRLRATILVFGKHYAEHLSLALDVFRQVRKIQDAKLLIVGPMRDGTEGVSSFVANYLENSTLIQDVECVGTMPFERLPEALSRADLFLHVKVGDSCPNAVLEAMACGLPVVCPAWGGTRELVGSAGMAVKGPPWDVNNALRDGMAEAVIEILENLEAFKTKARERAVEKFYMNRVAEQYLAVLRLTEDSVPRQAPNVD